MKKTTEITMYFIFTVLIVRSMFPLCKASIPDCTITASDILSDTGEIDHRTTIALPAHKGYYLKQFIILEIPYNDTTNVYLTHSCSLQDDRSYMDVAIPGPYLENTYIKLNAIVDQFLGGPDNIDLKEIVVSGDPDPSDEESSETDLTTAVPTTTTSTLSPSTPQAQARLYTLTSGKLFDVEGYIKKSTQDAMKAAERAPRGRRAISHERLIGDYLENEMKNKYSIVIQLDASKTKRSKRSTADSIIRSAKRDINVFFNKRIQLYREQLAGLAALIAGNVSVQRGSYRSACINYRKTDTLIRCVSIISRQIMAEGKWDVVVSLLGDYLTRLARLSQELALKEMYMEAL